MRDGYDAPYILVTDCLHIAGIVGNSRAGALRKESAAGGELRVWIPFGEKVGAAVVVYALEEGYGIDGRLAVVRVASAILARDVTAEGKGPGRDSRGVVTQDKAAGTVGVGCSTRAFTGPGKGLTLAKQAKDRETALRAAMGFEKDTLLFYYDLREMMVSEAERGTISDIILEEKAHLRRLAKML